jgi:hypothetical protein
LSQIFVKLEEESERRAIEAEEAAHSLNTPDLATAAQPSGGEGIEGVFPFRDLGM